MKCHSARLWLALLALPLSRSFVPGPGGRQLARWEPKCRLARQPLAARRTSQLPEQHRMLQDGLQRAAAGNSAGAVFGGAAGAGEATWAAPCSPCSPEGSVVGGGDRGPVPQNWTATLTGLAKRNPGSPADRVLRLPRIGGAGSMTVNRTHLLPDHGSRAGSMELVFVGTASCLPSSTRGVSCTVLRRDGDLMVFDAGEGTQLLMQSASISVSHVRRLFVTHAHGDHTFGLAGLLCFIGATGASAGDARDGRAEAVAPPPPLDIYGPRGLRDYLRASLQLTVSARNTGTMGRWWLATLARVDAFLQQGLARAPLHPFLN